MCRAEPELVAAGRRMWYKDFARRLQVAAASSAPPERLAERTPTCDESPATVLGFADARDACRHAREMTRAVSFSFSTAAAVPLGAIVRAINLTYPQDHDSVEGYAEQLRDGQVDLARSLVALDPSGQVAGIAMLGVRGERGWCGDAAVIPQYQNQKLGQALMRRLSDSARQAGLESVALEVRDDNAPARRVYEKEGYRYTRRMPCYLATLDELGWRGLRAPEALHVRRAADEAELIAMLLRWYGTRFVARPCWERELPSLLTARRRSLWTASAGLREVACLLAGRDDDARLHIGMLGLTDDAAHQDVRTLLAAAMRDTNCQSVRIGLEPIDSRVAEMLRDFEFRLDKDLWEMLKPL